MFAATIELETVDTVKGIETRVRTRQHNTERGAREHAKRRAKRPNTRVLVYEMTFDFGQTHDVDEHDVAELYFNSDRMFTPRGGEKASKL